MRRPSIILTILLLIGSLCRADGIMIHSYRFGSSGGSSCAAGAHAVIGSSPTANSTNSSQYSFAYCYASAFEAEDSCTMASVLIYVDDTHGSGSGHGLRVALYAHDDGPTGSPLAYSNEVDLSQADGNSEVEELAFVTPYSVTVGTYYWVAVWTEAESSPSFDVYWADPQNYALRATATYSATGSFPDGSAFTSSVYNSIYVEGLSAS